MTVDDPDEGHGRRNTDDAAGPSTAEWDPLIAFDADLLERVAAEEGIDVSTLRADVADHQRFVHGYEAVGGVDGLVYEWRQSFARDPVVERQLDRYHLRVDERVWGDFRRRLDLDRPAFEALRALHAAQFERDLGTDAPGYPLLLVRDPSSAPPDDLEDAGADGDA